MKIFKQLNKTIKYINELMATITINNSLYQGRSISVRGKKIYIDNNEIVVDEKIINITVEGNLDRLEAEVCNDVKINGNVGTVAVSVGEVEITGNVEHDVVTSTGDAKIGGDVRGDVKTMTGDISAKSINGKCSTMNGDISIKK